MDMMRMTKRRRGKAYITSMKRVIRISVRPPRNPASAPKGTPMRSTITCEPRPTSMDTRAP
jgi:hypothetical protein